MPPTPPLVRPAPLRRLVLGLVAWAVLPYPGNMPPDGSSARPSATLAGRTAEAADCAEFIAAANRALQEAERSKSPARAREALGVLERAARICPEDPEIPFLVGLADVLLADADGVRAAVAAVERLVTARALEMNRPKSEGENDPRALYLRALSSRNFGKRPDRAIEFLNRIRARAPEFLPDAVMTVLFWSHIDYAILLSEDARDEDAVKQASLAEAVARSSRFGAQEKTDKIDLARHRRAQVLASGTRWAEAQDLLEDLAKRYPNDAHVRFDLSTAYAEQIRLDEAIASWRETLRLLALPDVDPRLVELLSDAPMRLGVCLCQRGDTKEGIDQLEKYVAVHANDVRGWFYLGKAAVQADDAARAVECFERARALDSSCESVLRELFKLYSTSHPDPKKAKELEDLIAKDKDARDAEMKRRHRARPDKTDGCK